MLSTTGLVGSITLLALTAPYGADDPPRRPRAENWDVYGDARLRLDAFTPFAVDETGTPSRAFASSGFVRAGAKITLLDGLHLDLDVEALNGYWLGDDSSLGATAAERPFVVARDTPASMQWFTPRRAALVWRGTPGTLLVGIQGWTWGSGILSHDGEAEFMFGDARQGNVVARLGGTLTPFRGMEQAGVARGLAFFVTADTVVRDDNAQLFEGDVAFAGQTGVRLAGPQVDAGLLLATRYQLDRVDPNHPATVNGVAPMLWVFPVDGYAKWRLGTPDDLVALFLEVEGVLLTGVTTRGYGEETIGGSKIFSHAAFVGTRVDVNPARMTFDVRLSYASGDDDPRDDVIGQFAMHSDHNVGLILFEEVLPMLSARAADRVADPKLSGTPPAGIRHAIQQGGVQNAIALNPTWRFRPYGNLDLRLGYVWAYAPTTPVDVYASANRGGYATSFGGGIGRHYGQELDAGLRGAFELPLACVLEWGLEGGIFLPGDAFAGLNLSPIATLRMRLDVRW